jgi:hypothetical protein
MRIIAATAMLGTALLFTSGGTDAGAPTLDEASLTSVTGSAAVPFPDASHAAARMDAEALDEVVDRYCVRCHSERRLTGNLSLEEFAVANAVEQSEISERVIRKLRADMMPPPGANRPAGDSLVALVETLERTIDEAAAGEPRPGDRPFQRLNRAEYQRAIADLFGVQVDAGQWLPLDQISASFDNVADVQAFSPTLMDAYLNAASEIARIVLGNPEATAVETTYQNEPYRSQHEWDRVEGAPYGTRGGISVLHTFPADGNYVVSLGFISGWGERFDDIDISVDRVRARASSTSRAASPIRCARIPRSSGPGSAG